MKSKLAIIGSGIAGMGAAWHLKDKYDITVFEKNNYIGGHTNTITVDDQGRQLPIDTGFIVYNHNTYPNLIELFQELGVETIKSNMSFSVWNQDNQLQWCGSSFNRLFAQRRNLLKPAYWSFLLEANRFNKEAPAALNRIPDKMSLADYLSANKHSQFFLENYIVPMGGAIWSTPMNKMLHFPARALIQFFQNHGLLGMSTHYQWYTVKNGAKNYMDRIRAGIQARQFTEQPVHSIEAVQGKVELQVGSERHQFDRAIIATHADQALAILAAPDRRQSELLSPFQYEHNTACLHTDSSVMPPNKRIWAAWNTKSRTSESGDSLSATVYHMNPLQQLQSQTNYFVSINEFQSIAPEQIRRTINYEHPLFNDATWQAQKNLDELNQSGPIFFCGSYFRYGFHEDALWSARKLARRLLDE